MKRDLWIKKTHFFKEAERLDDEYYIRESPEDRLSDIQFCREQYFIIKGINIDESRRGLRRVFKVIKALNEFGISSPDLNEDDFVRENNIVQLGYAPVRIDIITSIEGFKFRDIWKNKEMSNYGDERVFFIGLKELIESKKKAGRDLDLVDVKKLIKRNKIKKGRYLS